MSSSVIASPPPERTRSIRSIGVPSSSPSASATVSGAGHSRASMTTEPACRPERSTWPVKPVKRVRSWVTVPDSRTNVPRPTPRSTSPRAASEASACRTVIRLTERYSASSRSGGIRSPGESRPASIRSVSCSSIWTHAGFAESPATAQPSPKIALVIGLDRWHANASVNPGGQTPFR